MVTIWDVAERAGVSKSTVSLVLNNSPRVRAETREKCSMRSIYLSMPQTVMHVTSKGETTIASELSMF